MRFAALLAVLLCGCSGSYDPPMQADHTSPQYISDLRRCRDDAHLKAIQIAGATPFTEIRSLFTSNEPERQNVRTCMQARNDRAP